jgi:hypothetical protein
LQKIEIARALRRIAEVIEWELGRARALKEIAEGMARVGMVEQAMEVFNQALRVAEGIEEADGRARALRRLRKGWRG